MKPSASFIKVEDAKQLIAEIKVNVLIEKIGLEASLGQTLTKDVLSAIDSPPFSQSTRDGYAIKYSDVSNGKKINIIGEIKAGGNYDKTISSGQAVRIFTGAPVPMGADTVIMQEKVNVSGTTLKINKSDTQLNEYINRRGSQRKKGEIALTKGTLLTPAAIGFLAGLGVKEVEVRKEPRITILVTGDELQQPGTRLKKGCIYDAAAPMLVSALKSVCYKGKYEVLYCKDSLSELSGLFKKALKVSDIIISTGGVSVGKYDYMSKVFRQSGVETVFYKVKQRPGKPLYFGRHEKAFVFGLPGNPAAVLTSFYEYIYPLLCKMRGRAQTTQTTLFLPISKKFTKLKGLGFFLKGITDYRSVTMLPNQESYYLDSFSQANCMVYVPEDKTTIGEHEFVEVHLLPQT